jgi:GLPGLI family protein
MKYISLVLLFSLSATVAAQDTAPVAMGKITYQRHTSLLGDSDRNGNTTLFFHPEQSLFVHNNAPVSDQSKEYEELGFTGTIGGDPTGFPILKLHQTKKIWFKEFVPFCGHPGISILSDTFATTAWMIDSTQTRTIGGFTCEKATGHYRGRDYEVWYAPDIPIPSGPFKLGGLPGLILEARSTDGNVQFLFTGIEMPLKDTIKLEMPPGGTHDHRNYRQSLEFVERRCREEEKKFLAQGHIVTYGPPFETIEKNANN